MGQYIPVAVPDNTTYPGADYYEIAVVEFTQKMHSNLTASKLRGYVQLSTSVVPGAQVALTNPGGSAILLPNGSQAYGVDIPRYLGPTIVAQKDKPVRIKFYNLLPTGMGGDLFLPVDTTVMGAGMGPIDMPGMPGMKEYYTQNRATLHLHGGNTPWISDGTAHQWITPASEDTVYPKGVSVYNVPDMPDPGPGAMTFYYTNQQSARLLFYHDHSYGITRLNVYAGEAAGYIIRDQVEQALITSGVIPADEIPLIIQDKTFVPDNTQPFTNVWGTFASHGLPQSGQRLQCSRYA
jgi:FtsP/CotA-like multicopper oxidase with cupredoxin domain